jgi:hypothetical protein
MRTISVAARAQTGADRFSSVRANFMAARGEKQKSCASNAAIRDRAQEMK